MALGGSANGTIDADGELRVGLAAAAPDVVATDPRLEFVRVEAFDLVVGSAGPCPEIELPQIGVELDLEAERTRDDPCGLGGALEVARDDRPDFRGARLESNR